MSPDAKKHLKAATDAMEAAVDAAYAAGKAAGIEIGVEQERERLRKVLLSEDAGAVSEVVQSSHPDEQKTARTAAAAGTFMNMARMMLAKDRQRTFSVDDVVDYFSTQYRLAITPDQVRPLLKVLTKQQEAQRVERGIYCAGPRLSVQASFLGAA